MNKLFLIAFAMILTLSYCDNDPVPTNYKVSNQVFYAKAIGCYDGDGPTIRVPLDTVLGTDTTYRLRLYAIDSPEHDHLYVTKKQPGSDIAADSLRKFIKGKKVRVETYYIDDFDRQVARVFVNDSIDLSLWMLEKGYTWTRTEPGQPKQERDYLADLQAIAKDAKLGFWALPGRQLRPSTWRSKYSAFRNVVNWY